MAEVHCVLAIKAIPNAPRSGITGWLGGALKVRIKSPPVDGRANEVLCEFLAATLDLPKRAITLQTGETSRLKRVRIEGLAAAEVRRRLTPSP